MTTEELEDIAAGLRQTAWLLAEYHSALRTAGLPDDLCHTIIADYHYETPAEQQNRGTSSS